MSRRKGARKLDPDDRVTPATLPSDLGREDVVLIGWPVAHSRSAAMHGAAMKDLGLPLRYRALAVHGDDVLAVVAELGRRGVRGANVTVPHKLTVMPACGVLTAEARLVGAVNTLTWERVVDGPSRLEGHNTDAVGLARALAEDVGDLSGRRALLVGTGGAARAAAVALTRAGARVSVTGRDPRGCAAILDVVVAVDQVGGAAAGIVDLLDAAALTQAVADVDLVLNATSLGMRGEHLPDPCERLRSDQIAYDVIYGATPTPFLAAAAAVGAGAHGGFGMLVHQAAASFARWTGVVPRTEVMLAAARG